jgi:hypothetical protein
MAKASKRPAASAAKQASSVRRPGAKPVKKATNLTLDPDAVARGERYGARHGRKLSQLVNGFLSALPGPEDEAELADLSPAVRRLYGAAAGGTADREDHRAHLLTKYGRDA